MSSCEFTICSQKGVTSTQDVNQKKQQQPDNDDMQSGKSQERQQDSDNQGQLVDSDHRQQASGDQEKQRQDWRTSSKS